MKQYIPAAAGAIILSIFFYACSDNTTSKAPLPDSSAMAKDSSMKQSAAVYTCKMHPEVTSDKPGKCPKCGMDLVKKESMPKDSSMQGMKMDSTK
ncbi:MAG TPA: heavy metal-binding domain-containing protein [Puia sp.]|nr:heavy metal-binding domain-containing protein [Puia sp.]